MYDCACRVLGRVGTADDEREDEDGEEWDEDEYPALETISTLARPSAMLSRLNQKLADNDKW